MLINKAFILSHFEYASPLFIGLSKCLSVKLESTNALINSLRGLFLITLNRLLTKSCLKLHIIKNLEHRHIEQALILMCKSIYGQVSNYIWEMFILHSNGYSLWDHLKVVIPRPASSYMQHSFMYQASKQWNNLPGKIRMPESLSTVCNCTFCK